MSRKGQNKRILKNVVLTQSLDYPTILAFFTVFTISDVKRISIVCSPLVNYLFFYLSPGSRSINNLLEDGYLISSTPQLQLYNVSYNQHGQYVCVAKNYIGLEER